jgi:transporter family protein
MLQPWILFSILSAVAYFVHDLILKQVSDKFDSTMASMLLNFTAFACLAVYALSIKPKEFYKVDWFSTESSLIMAAGVCLALASVFFINIFSNNGDLSLAIPLLYVLIIFLGVMFGVLLYKESLNFTQILGIITIVIGIVFVTRQ